VRRTAKALIGAPPLQPRVAVEFSRSALVPPYSQVRVYYDVAENGGQREIVGIAQLTTLRRDRVVPVARTTIGCRRAVGHAVHPAARRCRTHSATRQSVRLVPQSNRQVEGLSVIDKKLAAENDGARKAALASFEKPYPSFGTPTQLVSIFPFMFSS
jgi:hypothetical protein